MEEVAGLMEPSCSVTEATAAGRMETAETAKPFITKTRGEEEAKGERWGYWFRSRHMRLTSLRNICDSHQSGVDFREQGNTAGEKRRLDQKQMNKQSEGCKVA